MLVCYFFSPLLRMFDLCILSSPTLTPCLNSLRDKRDGDQVCRLGKEEATTNYSSPWYRANRYGRERERSILDQTRFSQHNTFEGIKTFFRSHWTYGKEKQQQRYSIRLKALFLLPAQVCILFVRGGQRKNTFAEMMCIKQLDDFGEKSLSSFANPTCGYCPVMAESERGTQYWR